MASINGLHLPRILGPWSRKDLFIAQLEKVISTKRRIGQHSKISHWWFFSSKSLLSFCRMWMIMSWAIVTPITTVAHHPSIDGVCGALFISRYWMFHCQSKLIPISLWNAIIRFVKYSARFEKSSTVFKNKTVAITSTLMLHQSHSYVLKYILNMPHTINTWGWYGDTFEALQVVSRYCEWFP